MKNMTTNVTTVLNMLTTHSHFIDTLLQHNDQKDEVKLSLVQLLHKLVVSCDKSCLNARDFGYLLPAYHGTLSEIDQCLLQIMIFYESNGMSMVAHKPFLFGNTALESYHAQRNASETLYKKPTPNRILACINSEIMIKSMEEFPIRRRMILHDSGPTPNFKTPTSDVYDPCFLVPALRELLLPENLVDCRAFLQQGALGYLYVCLSSHCAHLRNMAASCIARYYQHADAQRFSEKNLTLYVIDRVRNAVRYKD
uniref:URB1 C-terminal domain-containing protein n=1 Tax=Ciona savignyi TaxID=51511 RepID=H2Y482_CIOSA